MQYRQLGKSAVHVSDICMGTMTFGSQTDEAEAFRILDRCLDIGINFFDTAEGYPVPPDVKWVGRTEGIVGRWIKTQNLHGVCPLLLQLNFLFLHHCWLKLLQLV